MNYFNELRDYDSKIIICNLCAIFANILVLTNSYVVAISYCKLSYFAPPNSSYPNKLFPMQAATSCEWKPRIF